MAPRPVEPRRRFVSARDGLRLAALDWAGPAGATPLLCLSGISRSGLDFLHVAEHFAGSRRIVALDYAGHGESGRAASPGRYAPQYHDAMAPDFCVGEIWTALDLDHVDAHRQLLVDYVDANGGRCAAFDFTTKGLLNQALGTGQYARLRDAAGAPAGGIGWWPQKMVTFVDNHDTGPSTSCKKGQNLWPVPCDMILPGYAYILTHPGIPTVFYPHVYNFGYHDAIAQLLAIRKAQGLTSTSSVAIQRAENKLYAAIIDGKVAMKIGSKSWKPGKGWLLAATGTQYSVWTKK